MNILDTIIARKRVEVEAMQRLLPFGLLTEIAADTKRTVNPMAQALRASSSGIIAEFKRRSPSKGDIYPCADPAVVVPGYQRAGAAACSVLTDTPFFGGSLTDLVVARQFGSLPLLRKDFVISPYQITQAYLYGADTVLLIAAVLDANTIGEMIEHAHSLGLQTLLELHDESELAKATRESDMTGVNNRNLKTFVTDTGISLNLANKLPAGSVKVAESGLRSMADIKRLQEAGYQGFLIGERFMATKVPAEALKNLLDNG